MKGKVDCRGPEAAGVVVGNQEVGFVARGLEHSLRFHSDIEAAIARSATRLTHSLCISICEASPRGQARR